MGIAQHPLGLGWFAWFCLVPLFLSLKDDNRFRNIFFKIFLWAFIYHLVSLYWLIDNIGIDEKYIAFITMILANLVCTLNIIVIFLIWHFINYLSGRKIWYSLPFIWVMIEYLSSLTQISFPWASISNTQAQESLLPMIQFIELTGMFGLTFWIINLNISLFYFFINRDRTQLLESISIFVLPLFFGLLTTFYNMAAMPTEVFFYMLFGAMGKRNDSSKTPYDGGNYQMQRNVRAYWPINLFITLAIIVSSLGTTLLGSLKK